MKKRLVMGLALFIATTAWSHNHGGASDALDNSSRSDENRARDAERKPALMLEFIDLHEGDVVLDWGSGGGYWTELFAAVVGEDGHVYANARAGERFDSNKDKLTAQYEPFGNIELMPLPIGAPIPLDDNTVDMIMLSYIYHHLHYADGAGETFPESSAALLNEFRRVLKPGGTFVVVEHEAIEGATREQSADWHRTPSRTAIDDITGMGFELESRAVDIYLNPDDDLQNMWGQTGLRGKTTSFVHKYTSPD